MKQKTKGVNLGCPKKTDYTFDYKGKGTLERDLFSSLYKNCKLVMILIPKNDEIYNEIKTIAELSLGIITQCLSQDGRYWRDDKFVPFYLSIYFSFFFCILILFFFNLIDYFHHNYSQTSSLKLIQKSAVQTRRFLLKSHLF